MLLRCFVLFSILIFVYAVIKLFNKKNNKINQSTPVATKPLPERKVQYLSNGRKLDTTLFLYYCDLLRLSNERRIDDHIIKSFANNRHALINKINIDSSRKCACPTKMKMKCPRNLSMEFTH